MPLYDYKSNQHQLEFFFHMAEDKPDHILISKDKINYYLNDVLQKEFENSENLPEGNYSRIFSVPNINIDATKPKTVGELARANTAELEKRGKLSKKKKKKPYTPWWRSGKRNKQLQNLTDKQKEKYVHTGKI